MNNGDDINNLLKTLGHDAGLYQDLAKYNASRAALRRAAMVRPVEPVAAVPAAPPPRGAHARINVRINVRTNACADARTGGDAAAAHCHTPW